MRRTRLCPPAGFSLVEMAVVLVIVGLLLSGLLPALSGKLEQQHRNDTLKQIDDIREALTGYAILNGRLPCPAAPTVSSTTPGAGMADCTLSSGVLPWATLGIPETDAWGRRYTYAAASSFTTANFTLSSSGTLNIKSAATGGSSLALNMPAVFVSHGSNGYGAYTTQGTQIAIGSSADETDNSNGDTQFVAHDLSPAYDDFVTWISPNILSSRMVAAGKLP